MASTFSRRGPPLKGSGVWHQALGQVPNSFGPGIRRSIVDQPFLYAALPPPLIPFIDLMSPVGGQHLFRCPLQIISPVGGADCMIFAAKRVSAVSARSENVLLQAQGRSSSWAAITSGGEQQLSLLRPLLPPFRGLDRRRVRRHVRLEAAGVAELVAQHFTIELRRIPSGLDRLRRFWRGRRQQIDARGSRDCHRPCRSWGEHFD